MQSVCNTTMMKTSACMKCGKLCNVWFIKIVRRKVGCVTKIVKFLVATFWKMQTVQFEAVFAIVK